MAVCFSNMNILIWKVENSQFINAFADDFLSPMRVPKVLAQSSISWMAEVETVNVKQHVIYNNHMLVTPGLLVKQNSKLKTNNYMA